MDNLEQLDKDFVLHTYARDYTHFVRGLGARIYTDKNEEYIDFTAGIGVNSVGHSNNALIKTISTQASKILHSSNLFLIEPQAKLAQKIAQNMEERVRSFFCNSGLEANECAIKIARKYGESSSRFEIITLKNSFHGRSIATLKACGQDKMHKHFAPFPEGFSYAQNISEAMDIADKNKRVVAIFIELIQGEGGIYALPKTEVQKLRDFTRQNDILLMIDEVQSGVWRSGEFLTSKIYDIKPDVVSLAKGLAGGVPIGATITNKIDIFESSDHGSTFGGNFLATSAALCVLELLESYKKSGELDKHIAYFESHLQNLLSKHSDIFYEICGIGFMRGLKMRDDETLSLLVALARKHHLLLLKSGNATLRFLPPLTITKAEMDEGFDRLDLALKEL